MAKLSILAGATSQSVNIFIQDSTVTTGAGKTGLAFNTSSLVAYYTFTGANCTATSITLATLAAVNSAYSSGGFKEIDATNMPGLYRLDIPNAALAGSNGRSVAIMLKGATAMAPCVLEIELTAIDNQSTGFGLVNASANAVQFAGQTITAAAGVTLPSSVASPTNITAGTITTVTNLTNAPTAGDFTATMKTSLSAATPSVTVSDKTGFSLTSSYDFAKGSVAMTESYAAQGATVTPVQALYGLTQQ